jgi:16S rRNA (cytidine1402-2'-O)-methyltransferase
VGTLYLTATPIGNLEDITLRAVRILSSVALIAAEDTRHTRRLLDHYQIHTPLVSYHEHNKLRRIEPILAALAQGDVALVSDAGTPALNDPGYELVQAVLAAGYPVSSVPGPSAPLAALVASGLPTDAFAYLGYLPRKSGERQQLIQSAAALPYTLIFLETPHRLTAALQDLLDTLGDRRCAVARELTKIHEEILRAPLSQALQHFTEQEPRGEFTLVIAGRQAQERWSEAQLLQAALQGAAYGESPLQLAAELAAQSGWPRRQIYRLILENSPAQDNPDLEG